MPEHDDLDLVLRSALNTYADPGPESGLERRVLARISAEASQVPRRRWLPWAIALPIAAGLLLLLVLFDSRQTHRPPEAASAPGQPLIIRSLPEPSKTLTTAPVLRSQALSAKPDLRWEEIAAKPAPLPKLDVFPTPQLLTAEELALAAFAASAPAPERQSLIEAQAKVEAPLSIAAIQIQPLEPPDVGAN